MDELPDELLISIISLLPAKERARTSVLAPRWRNLWKFLQILNFDDAEISQELSYFDDAEISQELSYLQLERRVRKRNVVMKILVTSVNRTLISHSMETLDELRIKSGLDNNDAEYIDRWIELALRKKVQKLELDFTADAHDGRWNIFRFHSLDYSPYVFPNVQRFDVPPHGLSLVAISLSQVCLSMDILDSLMLNCPNLEDLRVEKVESLESLGPSCPAARLRNLSLVDCKNLSKIEICAPNLVSYELLLESYEFTTTKLHGVSSLVHLSLGGYTYDDVFFGLFRDVQGCVSRLETLKLEIWEVAPRSMLGYEFMEYERVDFKFPSLPQLRRLVLEVDKNEEDSILCLTPLVNAAPSLEEIVLRLMGRGAGSSRKPEAAEIREGEKHECVKMMKIENYLGKAVDVEMILYVMDHAPNLGKVVIDDVAHTGQDLHLLKRKLMKKLRVFSYYS